MKPYTQKEAVGAFKMDNSIICWPIFTTSITPIMTTSEVVLTIRVDKLIAPGSMRRTACGIRI